SLDSPIAAWAERPEFLGDRFGHVGDIMLVKQAQTADVAHLARRFLRTFERCRVIGRKRVTRHVLRPMSNLRRRSRRTEPVVVVNRVNNWSGRTTAEWKPSCCR